MKKSSQVPASLIVTLAGLSGVAGTIQGCGSGGYDDCVDANGRIIADSACRSGYSGAHYIHRGGFGSSGSSSGFFGG